MIHGNPGRMGKRKLFWVEAIEILKNVAPITAAEAAEVLRHGGWANGEHLEERGYERDAVEAVAAGDPHRLSLVDPETARVNGWRDGRIEREPDRPARIGRPTTGKVARARLETTVDRGTLSAIDADRRPGEGRGRVIDRWSTVARPIDSAR